MQVLVGRPYLWDVRRKARSGYCGPFVGYEYFSSTYLSAKQEEKERNPKKKEEEETKIKDYKRREEKETEKKRRNITYLAT